jgi:hypothetical protein
MGGPFFKKRARPTGNSRLTAKKVGGRTTESTERKTGQDNGMDRTGTDPPPPSSFAEASEDRRLRRAGAEPPRHSEPRRSRGRNLSCRPLSALGPGGARSEERSLAPARDDRGNHDRQRGTRTTAMPLVTHLESRVTSPAPMRTLPFMQRCMPPFMPGPFFRESARSTGSSRLRAKKVGGRAAEAQKARRRRPDRITG